VDETIVETKKKRVSKKKTIETPVSEAESVVVSTPEVDETDPAQSIENYNNTLEHDNHDNDFVDIIVESISINQHSFFIDQNNILYHSISLLPIASFHDNKIIYFNT
jgi:hypothetical protein